MASQLFTKYLRDATFGMQFDFIRELYQELFDKRIRHSMGEFFTPDWLAEYVIKETLQSDNIQGKIFLDPTCGSGTFINRLLNMYRYETSGGIFNHVFGIDINPVSVLAAKANFIFNYLEYFGQISEHSLKVPIYNADVIKEKNYQLDLFSGIETKITDEIPRVDYIIGNPPWVNWEYLPTDYKHSTSQAWQYYQLYNGKGLDSNFLKEDISCLITYVVADNYLKEGGKLGFLLKESLVKSVRQAKGFRKFNIFPTNTSLAVQKVIDLTNLKPFSGVNPRTIILSLKKGGKTKYPVNYLVLKPKGKKRSFDVNIELRDVISEAKFDQLKAEPIDANDKTSPWKTLDDEFLQMSNKIRGVSFYRARTGVFTGGANAIYWLNIKERTNDNNLLVQNITQRAKNKVESILAKIEPEYIFPFITGSDLSFWDYDYSKYILCPHTKETKMHPIDREAFENLPLTWSYLERFKDNLMTRKGFTGLDKHIHNQYFYTLQRIGIYTFEPYKVAWKYISKTFTPVVIESANDKYLNEKNIIPNGKNNLCWIIV